jgi:RNA polymerase sigma factor (sigma-70 family)
MIRRFTLPLKTTHCTAHEQDRLLKLALRGEQDALNRLFSYHMPQLYFRALRILGRPQDAEDALQDGLLSAVSHLKDFEGRSQFSTWLSRIVVNSALMQLRKCRPQSAILSTDQESNGGESGLANEVADFRPNPEDIYAHRERVYLLERKFKKLPKLGCSALQLRFFAGMSVRDAAAVLGVPLGTFKSSVRRALVKLKADLKPSGGIRSGVLALARGGGASPTGRSKGADK